MRILGNETHSSPASHDIHFDQPLLTSPFCLYSSAPDLVPNDDDAPKKSESKPSADAGEPEEEDIKLVMDQANVDREKAIKVIKENDGDMINASKLRRSVLVPVLVVAGDDQRGGAEGGG